MLAYVLAIIIAMGSFSFYMTAFFVPEMHRRQDFVWSGLGLFYAVVLWFCAGRITGAVLLGQVVSVALLGGLGWHTLNLRRDLTPESVKTPVTWADLQRWWGQTQQILSQYLKMGSLLAGVKAIAADISAAIADLQNRTAGPRGVPRPDVGVPPLKRSPAYEFETEQGQGESVPSEFATVPTRPRQATGPSARVSSAPVSPKPATASGAISPPPEPVAQPATPPPTAAEAPAERPVTPRKTARSQPSGQPAKGPADKAVTSPVKPPTVAPKAPRVNPVTGLATWVGDVAKGFRKPKPQRAVIEIPPRPPSIPRSPATARPQDEPPTAVATPATERSAPPSPTVESNWVDKNWVDVGDEKSSTAASVSPAAPVRANETPAETGEELAGPEPPPSPASERPPIASPVEEPETNWPDDDDTNWPD